MGQQLSPPASVIYFKESSGVMAKSLGTRIRDQGAMTRLIWSRLFRSEENIIENAQAVVIEDGCPNAAKIALCYERFAHDCEIHYVSQEGDFIEEPDYIRAERQANPALPGQAVDPRDAIKNLAAATPAVAEAPSEPEPREDEPGTDADVSDEELLSEVEDVPADGDNGSSESAEPDSELRESELEEEDSRD
jgi:hypothetical protein